MCLHLALLGALGLREPPPEQPPVTAVYESSEPTAQHGELLAADATAAREETFIPVSVQEPSPTPVASPPATPETPETPEPPEPPEPPETTDVPKATAAPPSPKLAPTDTEAPEEQPPTTDPATRTSPESEPATAPAPPRPPESSQSTDVEQPTGEDWLRIEDQLDTEPDPSPAATDAQSAPEPDPLVQRLLEAEARKARERERPSAPPESPNAATSTPPSLPTHAADANDAPSTAPSKHPTEGRLLETLAYQFSHVAGIDAGWDSAPLGRLDAALELEFADGKLESWNLSDRLSPQLKKALRSTLFYAQRGKYFGRDNQPLEGAVKLSVRVELSRVRADAVRGGVVTYERMTDASGRYLPIAYAVRPSLRKILVEIEPR